MKPSQTDIEYLKLIRAHILDLIKKGAQQYDTTGAKVLEIGPGEYTVVQEYFTSSTIYQMDIDPEADVDITGDITSPTTVVNTLAEHGDFDVVVCTDVLEHVENPQAAIRNIASLMKKGGIALISTPLNFRMHGMGGYTKKQGLPPDYWRFTETGLRTLISDIGGLQILEFDRLESDRAFFPIHFTVICRKV